MTTAQASVIVAACITLVALAAAVVQAQEPTMSLPNATVTADFGSAFHPAEVIIPAGGTVEWRNASFFPHAVTDDPAQATTSPAPLPSGAQPFDSGEIGAGGAWRRSFTVPGRYVYFYRRADGRHLPGVVIVE